jgi:hypothetical protein
MAAAMAMATARVTATATATAQSPSLGEGYYNATSYNYATLALYATSCYNATLE